MVTSIFQHQTVAHFVPFKIRFWVRYNLPQTIETWKARLTRRSIKTSVLNSFPAGENPFWHDSYHTGVSLGKNVLAMNSLGYADNDVDYIILVHIPTGQRIRVDFKAPTK